MEETDVTFVIAAVSILTMAVSAGIAWGTARSKTKALDSRVTEMKESIVELRNKIAEHDKIAIDVATIKNDVDWIRKLFDNPKKKAE